MDELIANLALTCSGCGGNGAGHGESLICGRCGGDGEVPFEHELRHRVFGPVRLMLHESALKALTTLPDTQSGDR